MAFLTGDLVLNGCIILLDHLLAVSSPKLGKVCLALGVFSLVETLDLRKCADSPLAVGYFVSFVGFSLQVVSNNHIDFFRDFCWRAAESGLAKEF